MTLYEVHMIIGYFIGFAIGIPVGVVLKSTVLNEQTAEDGQ